MAEQRFDLSEYVPVDLRLWRYLEPADSTVRPLVTDLSHRYALLRLTKVCITRPSWDCEFSGPFRAVYMISDSKLLLISLETGEHTRDLQVFSYKDGDTGIQVTYTHPSEPKPLTFHYCPKPNPLVENSP